GAAELQRADDAVGDSSGRGAESTAEVWGGLLVLFQLNSPNIFPGPLAEGQDAQALAAAAAAAGRATGVTDQVTRSRAGRTRAPAVSDHPRGAAGPQHRGGGQPRGLPLHRRV